ncbi:UPF0115 protein YfcN [Buchnera aphidicola (Pterocallis alni)]|uniref:endonuclease SmrB n=1 Tax=Buchnera aphidicola TaxID=9 RepID=UPI003464C19F
MGKNKYFNYKDIELFYQECKGIKKINQDTVFHNQHTKLNSKYLKKKNIHIQDYHSNFFTFHNYKTKIITQDPVAYVRNSSEKNELKKLKNKYYIPEISLDVHGLNQLQVKKELGKLIFICHIKKFFCFSVIHGHGKNILKNQIPIWLSQHPDIIAFSQSPNIVGYYTALCVLIENN